MSRVRFPTAGLGVLSTALVVAASLIPSTIPTAGATSGTITRSGQQFMLNGAPYRAGGSNQYYMTYRSQFMVRDALQTAASNNFQVMRVWGFLDIGNEDASNSLDPNANAYGVAFQFFRNGAPVVNTDGRDSTSAAPKVSTTRGGLEHLDFMLQQANALNLRLVIVLVNNWRDFGGMDQYVRWRGLSPQFHDQFYTDPTIRGWYQNFVRTLLNRTNSLTGVQYKNDPGIFAWELANEPRCVGSGTGQGGFPSSPACTDSNNQTANTTEIHDMAAFVKSQDPNHLVGVGDEGFFCAAGSSDFVENCTQGTNPAVYDADGNVDYVGAHLYPDFWGKDGATFGPSWIQRHIDLATTVNKPFLLGEFGSTNQGARNQLYASWTTTLRDNGGDVSLPWLLSARQEDGSLYPDFDGFTIYCPNTLSSPPFTPPNTSTCDTVIRPFNNSMSAPPPPTLTPTRTATAVVGATNTPTRTPTAVVGATNTPTRTATAVASGGGTCRVTYKLTNQWNNTPTSGGFQIDLSITNNGTSTINGWTLTYAFPNGQTIGQLWNAAFTQSGANVTITSNQPWNSL
jgi:mannan endo-1,4-beta-mannosidase